MNMYVAKRRKMANQTYYKLLYHASVKLHVGIEQVYIALSLQLMYSFKLVGSPY